MAHPGPRTHLWTNHCVWRIELCKHFCLVSVRDQGAGRSRQCPVAAVTNFHRFKGLKQHKRVLLQLWGSSVRNGNSWGKPRCQQGCIPSGRLCLCIFCLPETTCFLGSWPLPPSPTPGAQHLPVSPTRTICFCPHVPLLESPAHHLCLLTMILFISTLPTSGLLVFPPRFTVEARTPSFSECACVWRQGLEKDN